MLKFDRMYIKMDVSQVDALVSWVCEMMSVMVWKDRMFLSLG